MEAVADMHNASKVDGRDVLALDAHARHDQGGKGKGHDRYHYQHITLNSRPKRVLTNLLNRV